MNQGSHAGDLAAAQAGSPTAFERIIAPYRRELLVHCYRLLGSYEDAEDAVQETLLRAWRRLGSFEGRAPLRAWLYKIATHAALDSVDRQSPRLLPSLTHPLADPHDPLPPPAGEPFWLDPLPNAFLQGLSSSPEAVYDLRESTRLAFLAALQYLPARQRAVLILRDVLCWRTDETAELLEMTLAAVNSALQRARETLKLHRETIVAHDITAVTDEQTAMLLHQYVQSWEAENVPRLVALLRENAVLTMPPVPAWYAGRTAIGEFLALHLFAEPHPGRFRLVITGANGGPAIAVYGRDSSGTYRPAALQVLTVTATGIAAIHDFLVPDNRLFTRFDLPLTLS